MRKSAIPILLLLSLLALQAPAQPPKAKMPYQIDFDPAKDVTQFDKFEGKDGIFIKVRFAITLDGAKVVQFGDDHKLVIEENGHRVKEVDVPKPVVSDDLSVMLALDTSGSMAEHGRMEQARLAADAFFQKLPKRTDCGLILFDHEIRDKVPPIYERAPILAKIRAVQPRGGTAYLDAASEAVLTLRNSVRGRDRAVVLMTDGIDLNSKKTIEQVIAEAKRENVRVYTIGIGEPGKLDKVNTVLALDQSGSMKAPASDSDKTPKIVALHLAAQRFVDSMSTAGRTSILPFSSTVGRAREFFDKKQAATLKRTIQGLEAFGETALFDATYEAVCLLEADGSKGKRAAVVMTDGIDNTSRRRVEEVIARAKEANVPLYMLAFGRDGEIDETTMRRMAQATGGKFYHAKSKDALIEIFENLSIQLHDDGIDEDALKQIAKATGGQYYPAKNVTDLKFILEQVTQNIQRESHEIVFASLNQRADGTQRNVTLKLVRLGSGGNTVLQQETGSYQLRGLVVAEMNHLVYLGLLVVIAGLIALPALLRRAPAH
jgi:uncharacterized protein with von Willebrand factor type A (vWA) domain